MSKAYRYLSRKCLKNRHRLCPRCRHRKKYTLKDGHYRCTKCKYTYHVPGRWINHGRLTCIHRDLFAEKVACLNLGFSG